MSAGLTAGSRFSLLWYMLSFTGWVLLTILFFPLMFYTLPYLGTAQAMYANYLIEKNRAESVCAHTQEFSRAEAQGGLPNTTEPQTHLVPEEPTVQVSTQEILSGSAEIRYTRENPPEEESAPVQPEPKHTDGANIPPDDNSQLPPVEQEPPQNGKWPYL